MEFKNDDLTTFEYQIIPLSNNGSKVEFSDNDFCINPRDYHKELEPFDYDGQTFYLVGSSFSPDLSIPLDCFDPFDPKASENFSTNLTPFLEQSVENAINFVNLYDERSCDMGGGNVCCASKIRDFSACEDTNEKSFRGTMSGPTKQQWSAKERLLNQHGNNGTRQWETAYHLMSYTRITKRAKVTWKEGEQSQFLDPINSVLDDYWTRNHDAGPTNNSSSSNVEANLEIVEISSDDD